MNVLIAVGLGNTTIKLGICDSADQRPRICWQQSMECETAGFDPAALANLLPPSRCRWFVSSVHRPSEQSLRAWQQTRRPQDEYHVLSFRDLPLVLDVAAPEQVGMDRLVAALAVNRLRRDRCPAIVVDAGTAITVDLLDQRGVYCGGVILPGVRLTARALAEGTDLLPNVDATFGRSPPRVVGRSTEDAMRSGLFWGVVGAIRELVARMSKELSTTPQLFVTGGDAERLTPHLEQSAQFVPDLVLTGIVIAAVTQCDESTS